MSMRRVRVTAEDKPKGQALLEWLRRQIVSGRYPAGSRLPTCRELTRKFPIGLMTAQRALERLAKDGFIVTQGAGGTLVVPHPPHLYRYGVVFSTGPDSVDSWAPLWQAMHQESLRVAQVDSRRSVVPYFHIDGHTDVEDYHRLLADVRAERLAGVILALDETMPRLEFHDPAARDLPIVTLDADQRRPPQIVVWFEEPERVLARALDRLAACGRQRVAVLHSPNSPFLKEGLWFQAVQARGMTTQPYWTLEFNYHTPLTAANVVRLLMSGPPSQRPDALFVAGPFLVEAVTAGIQRSGVNPKELDIVAIGNYPLLTQAHVPVHWLTRDVRELVRLSVSLIDRLRRGERVAASHAIPTAFREEMSDIDPLEQLCTKT
jgi:DNA-binding LacI/PurR family transcriptional regulator